jgi:hypothetical protein
MTDTPLASVFSAGRYVGAILHRGCKGYEAVAESGESHGCFPSQKEAAVALQPLALHALRAVEVKMDGVLGEGLARQPKNAYLCLNQHKAATVAG